VDDVFMHIGLSLYLASNGLTSGRSDVLEASLLDNLKKHFYQHVPITWYLRRFELFRERLKSIVIYFQPVLCLQPKSLYISAWEALARDRDTGQTPNDIFEAAQIWGTRFVTELDLYCTEQAIQAYMGSLRDAKMQRPHEIPDLCINVYPSSIMRDVFMRKLEELLNNHPLRRRLVLEISEKFPLPPEAKDMDAFRDRLELFVKTLEVSFAIDDFGVGYSSVERLARLSPSYVKIDREVLHLQTGDHAIRYVLDVTSSKRLSPSKVVIEGFDGDSDLSLAHLYSLGVRYVQGFTIGKAGPQLYRIKKEDAKFLEALLVDKRAAGA
jgi:EAL domain-containing protein (putative c-di-GMP-specific phosphodiesterase class I)